MAMPLDRSTRDHFEHVMGLMNCRDEFGPYKPLKGARITGSSHMTIATAVLIETLTALGGEVRWCSSNILSAQDQLATAIAFDSASVFTWKGDTRQEYWRCIDRALDWGPGGGPDLIIDDGADATLLILEGVKAEEIYAKTGQLPDPCSTDNTELQTVLTFIKDELKTNSKRYHNMKQRLVGVCLGTTDCVERLLQMQANGTLLFPVINISDSVTNVKFSYLFDCRYALLDGIKRATNMTISGKRAVVCGYRDEASEGCAVALKKAGANVVVYEVDPKHILRARLRGFSDIIKSLDYVVPEADVFVINFNMGNNIDVFDHVKKMKNSAIIYITNPILNHNIGNTYAEVEKYFSGMMRIIVDPQTDKWVSSDTNSSIIVLRNKGYPNVMSSWSSTSHVVAILDLWSKRGTGKYEEKVYDLPEHLEEKVSSLHLATLTKTTNKETKGQADDHLIVTKRSDKKCTLVVAVQACSVIGMVALGIMQASKVGTDLPFSAIWSDLE